MIKTLVQTFLAGTEGQLDEDSGRMLLGDNTGGGRGYIAVD
jgi:hypothetical protein